MSLSLTTCSPAERPAPPEAAHSAIWQLFDQGLLDENMATAGLLAVDIGLRRSDSRATTDQFGAEVNGRRT